jgi:hypothetical protein
MQIVQGTGLITSQTEWQKCDNNMNIYKKKKNKSVTNMSVNVKRLLLRNSTQEQRVTNIYIGSSELILILPEIILITYHTGSYSHMSDKKATESCQIK